MPHAMTEDHSHDEGDAERCTPAADATRATREGERADKRSQSASATALKNGRGRNAARAHFPPDVF